MKRCILFIALFYAVLAVATPDLPLKLKEVIGPDEGIWVGKSFDLKVVLEGDARDLKSLDILTVRIDDPNTDYRIGAKIENISNSEGESTFVFKNLLIKEGKPAGDYELEFYGVKKGHPALYHDDIFKYIILHEKDIIQVNSNSEADTAAPELLSFKHSFNDNVVKIVVKAKDQNEIEKVHVDFLVKRGEDHWSGGFIGLEYNENLDQWELEYTLDPENQAFKTSGSVGMEDSLDNYEIVDGLDKKVIYEYQK